mmetsp:Transcript_24919/g.44313  ORF Transcript_24919/g.44313 Transcript_24919/m.44313 type:complete len:147 (+) Transcript_24919:136-576(+)
MATSTREENPNSAAHQQFVRRDNENTPFMQKADQFSDGLLNCCRSPGLAIKGFFCPCCLAAENSSENLRHDYHYEFCCYLLCYPIIAPMRRGEYRRKFSVEQVDCKVDCCAHCCCPCCALCQERRHVIQYMAKKKARQRRQENNMQ